MIQKVKIEHLQQYGTDACLKIIKFLIEEGFSVSYDYSGTVITAEKESQRTIVEDPDVARLEMKLKEAIILLKETKDYLPTSLIKRLEKYLRSLK